MRARSLRGFVINRMKTHNLYSDDNALEQTYSDWEGKSWAEAATPKPDSGTESEQD